VPKPIATVILPAKDAGAFIGTTLKTLTTQFDDLSSLKLVAIDDGSSDRTAAVMLRAAEQFAHAEVITNPQPLGLATARNQGLDRVEGDYVCFVDGDDWLQPRRLQSLVASLRDLSSDFVRTDHLTDTQGRRKLVRAPFAWRGRTVPAREAILPADEPTMVDYPYAWAGMFHRRLVDAGLLRFNDGLHTAEDRPWIWRLHLGADSFAVVDAPALLYRRGVPSSLTQVLDRRQLDFVPAFAETLRIVAADREAERFAPKIAATTFAVCAHHVIRARDMKGNDRRLLRTGVLELIASMPPDIRDAAYTRLSDKRRRVLAPMMREVRRG